MEGMSAPACGPRFRRASPAFRLSAAVLVVVLSLSVPAAVAAEALACHHPTAHGEHHAGSGSGDHHAPGHPHDTPEGPTSPPGPCLCPHPCAPAGSVDGASAPTGISVTSPHRTESPGPAWDSVSLPFFDPQRIPSGPDPPLLSFLR